MRIMCVGDSNTAGVGNPPWPAGGTLDASKWIGYRYKLKQILEGQNIPVDFVGSQSAGGATFADCQHEGWPGDGVAKIQERVSAGFLETYQPDVLLLLIGSNDMWVSLSNRVPTTDAQAQVIVGKLSALVIDMTTRRSGMLLLIGKPPTPVGCERPLGIYRTGIDQIAALAVAQGKHVQTVDLTGCQSDGVHYTPVGHELIASRWSMAITHAAPIIVQPPVNTGTTGPAILTNVFVVPATGGDTNTQFTFTATYTNPAGVAPEYAYLVVAKSGKVKFIGATTTGTNWTAGVIYHASAQLEVGTYTYQFEFKSGGVIHRGNPVTTLTVTAAVAPTEPDPYEPPVWTGIGQPMPLRVSADKRYLVDTTGRAFFYLADTAWTVVTSLSAGEMRTYLDKRKAQGFNAVQMIGAHWGAASPLTANGQLPFLNANPATPNPAYWSVVDTFVQLAAERGILASLIPAWFDFVTGDLHQLNTNNARAFGTWVGNRYRNYPNIIWVLGGDCKPTGFEPVFNELAAGINTGDGTHLITFHPGGGGTSAAAYFPSASWLSFSMIQTQHGLDIPDYAYVLNDYNHTPVRPVLLAESRYEDIIPWPLTQGQRIDDHQVRKSAWSAVLSGSCGYGYGSNAVFQFYKGGQEYWKPSKTWTEALDFPGAASMAYLRQLMESVPWWKLVPDHAMITEGLGTNGSRVVAARAADRSFALIYVPEYTEIVVNLVGFAPMEAQWYDPRTGLSTPAGTLSGQARIFPPTGMGDPDYVLVLEV